MLALLMWTLCGTFGVSPYRCIIFRTFVMCSLVPVSSRIVFCSSLGVHLGWTDCSIIRAMVSRGIFGGRPVLGRSRRPSRPPVSKRFSHLCTHLSDRIRLAAVSPMLIWRTQTMWTASILSTTLESFSFLYAFSSSSRFVLSIPHQHGRGSLLVLVWGLQSERTFNRRYKSNSTPSAVTKNRPSPRV